MDKLYNVVLIDIINICTIDNISNSFTIEKYHSRIISTYIRKKYMIVNISKHNIYYLKRYLRTKLRKRVKIEVPHYTYYNSYGIRYDVTIDDCISYGSIRNAKFLEQIDDNNIDDGILITAIKNNHIDILKWLLSLNILITHKILVMSLEHGNLDIIRLLEKGGGDYRDCNYLNAAKSNNLEVLEWFKRKNCVIIDDTLFFAMQYNCHIKCIEWLLKNKCPLTDLAYGYAIARNDLEMVKLLRSYNCPFATSNITNTTLLSCIINGTYEIAKWIIANGYPYTNSEIESAERKFGKKLLDS